jgi:hypothetical protein
MPPSGETPNILMDKPSFVFLKNGYIDSSDFQIHGNISFVLQNFIDEGEERTGYAYIYIKGTSLNDLSLIGDGDVVFENSENITLKGNFTLRGNSPGGLQIIGTEGSTLTKSSGTVNAYNCSFIQSTVSGGATFNAFISNGCVDVADNIGWNFE